MEFLIQQLINGLTVGSIYALVALGYTMVYGVLRLINFAHGELFMLGAYMGFTLIVSFGLSSLIPNILIAIIVMFILTMGLVAVAGVATERIAYRPLREVGRLPAVVSALGVSIFIQNAVMLTYGTNYQVFPEGLIPSVGWTVFGAHITLMRVVVLFVSFALLAALYWFIQRTTIGTAIRAIAVDHRTARLMGIDVNAIIALVFVIGPALGGTAGLLVAMTYNQLNFTMGWQYGLKAFTAAILGGIGNIPGAMLGGILLGIVEALAASYMAAGWQNAISFLILILILTVRPTGILGERVAEKL